MRFVVHLFVFFFACLLTSPALAFSEDTDRGRMDIWTDKQGEFSFVFFGSRGIAGIGQQPVGQCPAANSILEVTNANVAGNLTVKELVTASGELKLDHILATLPIAQDADAEKLAEQRALACLAYWTGAISQKSAYLRIQAALDRALERLASGGQGPVVFLLDSPFKVYDVGTATHGETNADQIAQRLNAVEGLRVLTANTSSTWRRTDDVISANPAVVVIHFSAFETEDLVACDPLASAASNNCMFLFSSLLEEVLEKTAAGVVIYSRVPNICAKSAMKNLARQIGLKPAADGRDRVVIVPMGADKRANLPFRWNRVATLALGFAQQEPIAPVAEKLGACVLKGSAT